ncbi:MAG: D-alanine--D-alanine ligase [Candidatus Humimicrobiaceae bacterium]|jgi:D-alanine-D-alanine ligase|nr:D-alanine--D-alanine ligase [Candidatus Humimicrobiaceae bacterium]
MSDLLKKFQNLKVRENKKSLKIGVIAGGVSSEREISLLTGKNIYDSLLRSGYNAVFIDPADDFFKRLKEVNIAFLALHGKYGEDGTIQGLLEFAGIPYTGSGILGSAIAINKILSKKIFQCENILTPDYIEVELKNGLELSELKKLLDKKTGYPVIVKPNTEGSTIGVSIVDNDSQLESAVNEALKYDNRILIEKYIKGRELTVSIIGNEPIALPIIEIKPKSGFYDYEAKYTSGMTEYVVPAELDDKLTGYILETAVKCHKALQCKSISRVDFILDNYNNAYVFELNTMPGMTETSLVPKAAKAAGISFDLLVEIILDLASLKV